MKSNPFLSALFTAILLLPPTLASRGQSIEVSGPLTANTSWGPNQTIEIKGDVTVQNGVTLTILSGCTIQFTDTSHDLQVNGTLSVQGTAGAPVLFQPSPGKTEWGGIYIVGGDADAPSSLHYAILEKGASSYFSVSGPSMLRIEDASPSITYCTFRNSKYDAIHLRNSGAPISYCTFLDNTEDAMQMDAGSSPVLTANTASGNGFNGTRIDGGTLSKNIVWKGSNLPYLIHDDITVAQAFTLTIEAGNRVQFNANSTDLIVQGTLTAVGTASQPIVFTSLGDSPEKSWGGVYLGQAAGASRLEFCQIRYGGSNYFSHTGDSMLRAENDAPTLVNCQIHNSKSYGLSLLQSNAQVIQTHFSSNTRAAGYMDPASFPVFTSVSATDNEYDAMEIRGGWIRQNGHWGYAEIPYLIQDDISVAADANLTIAPKTEIQFKQNSGDLIVYGTLMAVGTAQEPIRFYPANRTPTPGSWGGLVFSGTESNASRMQYCELYYGGSGYFSSAGNANLRCDNASPGITDCKIAYSKTDGINLYNSTSTIERCATENCTGHAIRMDVESFPFFQNNTASGNGYNVITVRGGTLSKSGRWDLADLHYNLENDVVVPEGIHLAIDAGNTIRFQANSTDLTIYGSLEALGTNTANIQFRPLLSQERGAMGGVYFGPAANSAACRLSYCIFEYGGSAYFSTASSSMVYCDGASPTFTDCTFRGSGSDGMLIREASPTLTRPRFQNNKGDAVEMSRNSFPRFSQVSASANGKNAIRIVGGEWNKRGQWNRPGIPYLIGEDVTVQSSGEITLEAGCTLQFDQFHSDLSIYGAFTAVGSEANPIRFTSSKVGPARGDWGSISFFSGSSGRLEYGILEYGGSDYFSVGGSSQIRVKQGAEVTLAHLTVQNSKTNGLVIEATETNVPNCLFNDNGDSGILALGLAEVAVTACQLSENQAGIFARENAVVQVTGCSFDSNEKGLGTEGTSARIRFGENRFSNNTRTGSVNFLTAASSQAGNLISSDRGGLEVPEGNLDTEGTFHALIGGYYEFPDSFYYQRRIGPSGSLQIRAGVYLALQGRGSLSVSGYLGVGGRPEQPVLIAAPPYVASSTATSLHAGILFEETGRGAIRNAVFRNADSSGAIDVLGPAHVSIEQCRFDFNGRGIQARGSAEVSVEYCQFLNNTEALRGFQLSGPVTMHFSQIVGNDAGVKNEYAARSIDTTLNWWGDASGPSGAGPGAGDSITTQVDFDPYFTSASQVPGQPLDAQSAELDTPYSDTLSRFALKLYKVPVEAGRHLLCRLTPESAESTYGLYGSFMSVPSVAFADTFLEGKSLSGSHELLIAGTGGGDYYVLVFALDIPGDQETFQIQFSYVDHYVSSLNPGKSGNRGSVTLNLYGTDFNQNPQVRLLGAGGRAYSADSVIASDPTHLHASINLQGAALGLYDLEVRWPSKPAPLLFPGAFKVVPGLGPRLETKLQIPSTIVWYRPYTIMLSYKNTGDSDLVAPIIKVVTKNKDSGISLTPDGPYLYEAGDFVQVLGIAQDGPAGVLRPGGSGEIPIYYRSNGAHGRVEFTIETLRDPNGPVDWDTVEEQVRPPDISGGDWQAAWNLYVASVGTTWGDYQSRLAQVANELWVEGARVYDIEELFKRSLDLVRNLPTAEVRGVVRDVQTRHPQANVVVILTESLANVEDAVVAQTTTDAEGAFAFTGLHGAAYDIRILGYPEVSPDRLDLAEGQILSGVEIQVPFGGVLEGTVLDKDTKSPIPGVGIQLTNQLGNARFTLTNEQGRYRFAALEASLYAIEAAGESFAVRRYSGLQIWPGQILSEVDFLLDSEKTITGTVTDALSSEKIQGAAVVAESLDGLVFTAETSATGTYTLRQMPPGTFALQCTANGYQTLQYDLVTVNRDGSTQIDLSLLPGLTQTGTVVARENSEGIPQAIVVSRNALDHTVMTAVTDKNGAFSLSGLTPGTHYIQASAFGRAVAAGIIQLDATGGEPIELALPLAFNLSGKIADAAGATPADEGFILIENAEGSILASSYTEQGMFSFSLLPQGHLRVKAIHPALSFPVTSIDLTSSVTGLELRAPSGGVSGTVSTATQSVADAIVAAYPLDDDDSGQTTLFTATSDNGSYSLLGLAAGQYLLVSATEGFARTTQQITVGESAISRNITLDPESLLTGRVQSPFSAEGLSGVPVWAVPTGSPAADPGQGTLTHQDGSFTIGGLGAGTYTVYAIADGFVLYATPGITLAPGNHNPPLSIVLSASGRILSGSVLDASGSVPLPGALLVLLREGIETGQVLTDSEGRYISDPLAPGVYDVLLSFGAHQSRASVTIADLPGSTEIDFSFPFSPLPGIESLESFAAKARNKGKLRLSGWFSTRDVPKDPREAILRSTDWNAIADSGAYCAPEAMGVQGELDSALLAYWNAQDALENASWSRVRENAAMVNQGIVVAGKIAELVISFQGAAIQALAALAEAREVFKDVNSIVGDINLLYGTITDYVAIMGSETSWDSLVNHLKLLDKAIGKLLDNAQEWKIWGKFGRLAAPIYKIKDIGLELWNLYDEYNQATATIKATGDAYLNAHYHYQMRISRAWAEYLKYRKCNGDTGDIPNPDTDVSGQGGSNNVASVDPNEKRGPGKGDGAEDDGMTGEVDPGQRVTYTIFFENLPSASAAAQYVSIEDYIDLDAFDLNSFELQEVAYGSRSVSIEPGKKDAYKMTTLGDFEVAIEAKLNRFTGKAFWELTLIDPETNAMPIEGGIGFLPPNNAQGDGEGHVVFSIDLKTDLQPGSEVRNQARIVFDSNEAIETNVTVHIVSVPPPDRPVNLTPDSEKTDLMPVLVASAYSYPATAAFLPHIGSEFQVKNLLGSLIWSSGMVAATSDIQVPTGELDAETAYQWHVRYQCESGVEGVEKWSDWSATTWFMTKGVGGEEDGDFNLDGLVNPLDLLTILKNWHSTGEGDMNGNGYVDWMDLIQFSSTWDGE